MHSVQPTVASQFQGRDAEALLRVDFEVDHVAQLLAIKHHHRTDEIARGREAIALLRVHLSLPGMKRKRWSRIQPSASPTSYASAVCLSMTLGPISSTSTMGIRCSLRPAN